MGVSRHLSGLAVRFDRQALNPPGQAAAPAPAPAPELPALRYLECATLPAVLKQMDAGGVDLAILDGEAVPAGGMGLCRQLKDEIYSCPPILVLTGRPQDAWLATWSRADGVVPRPLDPMVLADTTAALLRQRLAGLPVR